MSDEEKAGAKTPRRRGRRRTDYKKTASEGAHAPVVQTSIRTEPIRVTLDLKPKQHRELKRWCNGAAAELDLSAVALAPVLRLLGEELVRNPELAETIKAELRKQAAQLP
ncbi:hypothetical protein [Streptomyces filamentosus]